MQLFFTGAQFFGALQNEGSRSLGGFTSGSVIPNGKLNAIFPEISKYTNERGGFEVRGIVLLNTTGSDILSDVYIWHEFAEPTGNRVKFEISPVSLLDNKKMEAISHGDSLPYVGNFYDTEGESNKILISNGIVKGGGVGLWVKRNMVTPDPIISVSCAELKKYMGNQKKEELTNVIISY